MVDTYWRGNCDETGTIIMGESSMVLFDKDSRRQSFNNGVHPVHLVSIAVGRERKKAQDTKSKCTSCSH